MLKKRGGGNDILKDLSRSSTGNWTDGQIHSLLALFVLEHKLWGKNNNNHHQKNVWLRAKT